MSHPFDDPDLLQDPDQEQMQGLGQEQEQQLLDDFQQDQQSLQQQQEQFQQQQQQQQQPVLVQVPQMPGWIQGQPVPVPMQQGQPIMVQGPAIQEFPGQPIMVQGPAIQEFPGQPQFMQGPLPSLPQQPPPPPPYGGFYQFQPMGPMMSGGMPQVGVVQVPGMVPGMMPPPGPLPPGVTQFSRFPVRIPHAYMSQMPQPMPVYGPRPGQMRPIPVRISQPPQGVPKPRAPAAPPPSSSSSSASSATGASASAQYPQLLDEKNPEGVIDHLLKIKAKDLPEFGYMLMIKLLSGAARFGLATLIRENYIGGVMELSANHSAALAEKIMTLFRRMLMLHETGQYKKINVTNSICKSACALVQFTHFIDVVVLRSIFRTPEAPFNLSTPRTKAEVAAVARIVRSLRMMTKQCVLENGGTTLFALLPQMLTGMTDTLGFVSAQWDLVRDPTGIDIITEGFRWLLIMSYNYSVKRHMLPHPRIVSGKLFDVINCIICRLSAVIFNDIFKDIKFQNTNGITDFYADKNGGGGNANPKDDGKGDNNNNGTEENNGENNENANENNENAAAATTDNTNNTNDLDDDDDIEMSIGANPNKDNNDNASNDNNDNNVNNDNNDNNDNTNKDKEDNDDDFDIENEYKLNDDDNVTVQDAACKALEYVFLAIVNLVGEDRIDSKSPAFLDGVSNAGTVTAEKAGNMLGATVEFIATAMSKRAWDTPALPAALKVLELFGDDSNFKGLAIRFSTAKVFAPIFTATSGEIREIFGDGNGGGRNTLEMLFRCAGNLHCFNAEVSKPADENAFARALAMEIEARGKGNCMETFTDIFGVAASANMALDGEQQQQQQPPVPKVEYNVEKIRDILMKVSLTPMDAELFVELTQMVSTTLGDQEQKPK